MLKSESISGIIVRSYMQKGFCKEIGDGLAAVAETTSKVAKVADALDFSAEAVKYLDWNARVEALMKEVQKEVQLGTVVANNLSGGNRSKPFITQKVHYDAAVIVIDEIVKKFDSYNLLPVGRTLYYGAGLVYYCGYDMFVIPKGQPFPTELDKEHSIIKRYSARRREARKYLSMDAIGANLEKVKSEISSVLSGA